MSSLINLINQLRDKFDFGPTYLPTYINRQNYKFIIYFLSRSFDPTNSGKITENRFVKIMKSKENVAEEDITEMIAGSLMLKCKISFKDHKLCRI